jgi:hypothetical protein
MFLPVISLSFVLASNRLTNTEIDYTPPASVLLQMQRWREQQEQKAAKTEKVLCGDTTGCAALRMKLPAATHDRVPARKKELGEMANALVTASATLQKLEKEMAEYSQGSSKVNLVPSHTTDRAAEANKEVGMLQQEGS